MKFKFCFDLFQYLVMPVVEFVEKLLTILEQQSDVVKWVNEGSEFEIADVEYFTKCILPSYFRHKRFESFIRQVVINLKQLNMYDFHKVNRRKNSFVFRHEHFTMTQEQNYSLIKRTKKSGSESKPKNITCPDFNLESLNLSSTAPNMAELLNKLIEFDAHEEFDHRKLKGKLEALSKQVSAKKERIIRPIIASLKQKISILDEVAKKMNAINLSSLTACDEDSPTKQCSSSPSNPANIKCLKIGSAPLMGKSANIHHSDEVNNIKSFNSISSFIVLN